MADVQPTSDLYANEQWKPVVGHEGSYEVSDMGRVRSLDRTVLRSGHEMKIRGRILKQMDHVTGYKTVGMSGAKLVHRMVLTAFVGPCPREMECRHLNGVRTDNRLTNLKWGSSSENNDDIVSHGHHWQVNKEVCPRGHGLEEPNLVPSQKRKKPGGNSRECLACSRARSVIKNHPGDGLDLQGLSDQKYAEILADARIGREARSNAAKTHCPRGHLLEMPNLVVGRWEKHGYRNCLACGRAGSQIRARGGDMASEMQPVSDLNYSKIMGGA